MLYMMIQEGQALLLALTCERMTGAEIAPIPILAPCPIFDRFQLQDLLKQNHPVLAFAGFLPGPAFVKGSFRALFEPFPPSVGVKSAPRTVIVGFRHGLSPAGISCIAHWTRRADVMCICSKLLEVPPMLHGEKFAKHDVLSILL